MQISDDRPVGEIPTKATVIEAMQAALSASIKVEEPWGNAWATGVLAAHVWLAKEADDGSDRLMHLLLEAGSHARVALHGTRGYPLSDVLTSMWTKWWLALPPDLTPCEPGCGICGKALRQAEGAVA
jgi:hypothetical protein